jgi:hypothetical protein
LRKLLRVFFFKLPQNRHPERSAAQMDRVTQRLGRVAEGPSAMLNLPMLLGAFQPPAPATVFHWGREPRKLRRYSHRPPREKQLKGSRRVRKLNRIGTINPEFKDLAQTWGWKMTTGMKQSTRDDSVRIAADPVVGFGG